ncbi:hypothetical protein FFLO_03942 [Filobasidium floriforme]|uniref:NADP-dependent oxidoreductase domain-containing protein n=1 Tax=Filobasidium floriforme TaxID=5210 RepID=A0A8K0JQ45_9TREE|nr:hypothetical protein FFLO_03942 [Filobasidium floriforme]
MPATTLKLNNGQQIPALGLGCWMSKPVEGDNPETYEMVVQALKTGYRHLDTAAGYGNEKAVGRAVRDSDIPRSEIFVTTKLGFDGHDDVEGHFKKSFDALDIEYIDLFLMHWPQAKKGDDWVPKDQSPTFAETWKEMEKLVKGGKCRSIGVSNFSVENLELLLKSADIVPAVNQVEANIYHPQASLHKYCAEKNIHLTAYCPIGQPKPEVGSKVLKDEVLIGLGEKYGKPAAAVALSWLVQRGNWSAVPKSANPTRMAQNLEIFELEKADFEALSKVHEQPGKLMISCDYGSGDIMEKGEIFGWSLKDMGWEKLD